jgi:hypothetical protein
MTYVPADDRYEHMTYRRSAPSGVTKRGTLTARGYHPRLPPRGCGRGTPSARGYHPGAAWVILEREERHHHAVTNACYRSRSALSNPCIHAGLSGAW